MELVLRQFYSLDGITLPPRYPVRVLWSGRGPFEAARVINPHTRAASWITYDGGYAVHLPCPKKRRPDPLRPWAGWHTLKGDNPDYWAPRDPRTFKLFPLPPPALILPDPDNPEPAHFWHEGQRYSAVDDAEQASERRRRGAKRELWWLIPSNVTHSPPGTITRDEAEGRIMRALAQDTLEDNVDGLGLHRNPLLGMTIEEMQALAEAEQFEIPSARPKFEATQLDRKHFDGDMAWFAALGARALNVGLVSSAGGRRVVGSKYTTAQRVLFLASRDVCFSFREMTHLLKRIERRKISVERVRQIYHDAVTGIWTIANEFSDVGRTQRDAALEHVKSSNRKAREQR